MRLGVAIKACASQQKSIVEAVVGQLRGISRTRMVHRRMALLAKLRWAPHQHGVVVASMRAMTQGAVFRSRCMFPEKRAALFGVTVKTGVVDTRLAQKKIIIAIVRVVTITAGHLAEAQGMIAGAESVRLEVGMTTKTGLLLEERVEYRVCLAMDLVARCA